MKLHFLPGDSLVEPFKRTNIDGEIAVCRECLVDGDLKADNPDQFWRVREEFLASAYPKPASFYPEKVRSEFEKLLKLPDECEIHLWFEYELFCQANMWFCLYLLEHSRSRVYRIAPVIGNVEDIWQGFGCSSAEDLEQSFAGREKFNRADLRLGADLWRAFRDDDFPVLQRLSQTDSKCFPFLRAVCDAAISRETRPKATLKMIIERGETEFGQVFRAFNEIEGIYGFGDLQVKRIYDELL